MKKILSNKAGVTVLEGVIALGLLALVTAGAFGVLLAASRQTTRPDVREEMILAVEKASNMLKIYTGVTDTSIIPGSFRNGLCGTDATPLDNGEHNIACQLPPICDRTVVGGSPRSTFTYTVDTSNGRITFNITCNGYML